MKHKPYRPTYWTRQAIRRVKLDDIARREAVGLLTPNEAAALRRRV